MPLDNARTMPLLFAAPPPNVTCESLGGIKVPTLVVPGERTPQIFSSSRASTMRSAVYRGQQAGRDLESFASDVIRQPG